MKTLLVIKTSDIAWMLPPLGERTPLLAPVCNKPLIEYWLDFAILCGSRHIRLATDMPLSGVEAVFGDGSRWGVELTYAPVRETDDLAAVLAKNNRYVSGSRLLVMEGFFFLNYDKQRGYVPFMQAADPGDLLRCATGRILIHDDRLPETPPSPLAELPPLALTSLRSAGDLHRISLQVLESDAGRYVLPGYNNEKDVFLGRNVSIARSARIEPPVMIGDHVQIHDNTVVGPGAVIGSNVIIDSHSRVCRSVVLDRTYVGEHLVLEHRLAVGNRLVNPADGTVVQLEDAQLLSGIEPFGPVRNGIRILGHGFLAGLLWVGLALPFLVLSSILKLQGRWARVEETVAAGSAGRTLRLARITIDQGSLIGRMAAGLALDRYPLLGRVVRGDLALLGNRRVPATGSGQEGPEADPGYRPGVFSYAEAEPWPVPESDQDIVDRFHLARRSLLYDTVMMGKIILNKLHQETAP